MTKYTTNMLKSVFYHLENGGSLFPVYSRPVTEAELRHIYINDDGYTTAGDYYGTGANLYEIWGCFDGDSYDWQRFRAEDHTAAKAAVMEHFSDITWASEEIKDIE